MARPFTFKRLVVRLCFLLLLAVGGLVGINLTATKPSFPAEEGGVLAPCPDRPNCVSTKASTAEHRMEPISWSGSATEGLKVIKHVIASNFRNAKLVSERSGYLRYEFTSLVFRFVDDVEFVLEEGTKNIHFRSASRVGHSDLGANRSRMTRFIKIFTLEIDALKKANLAGS